MIYSLLAATTQTNSSQVVDIAGRTDQITSVTSIGKIIEMGAGLILVIGGLAFLVYLLMGGFNWITAGGDKGKVEKARDMIVQGVIGLAVLASVFALYGVILRFLGIKGISLGQGGSGSETFVYSGECSDYCAGTTETNSSLHPDQCESQGGKRVSRPCSFDKCAGVTYPCLIR